MPSFGQNTTMCYVSCVCFKHHIFSIHFVGTLLLKEKLVNECYFQIYRVWG